mgnify:FL=1
MSKYREDYSIMLNIRFIKFYNYKFNSFVENYIGSLNRFLKHKINFEIIDFIEHTPFNDIKDNEYCILLEVGDIKEKFNFEYVYAKKKKLIKDITYEIELDYDNDLDYSKECMDFLFLIQQILNKYYLKYKDLYNKEEEIK